MWNSVHTWNIKSFMLNCLFQGYKMSLCRGAPPRKSSGLQVSSDGPSSLNPWLGIAHHTEYGGDENELQLCTNKMLKITATSWKHQGGGERRGILRECFIYVRIMASSKGWDENKTKDKQIKNYEHQEKKWINNAKLLTKHFSLNSYDQPILEMRMLMLKSLRNVWSCRVGSEPWAGTPWPLYLTNYSW